MPACVVPADKSSQGVVSNGTNGDSLSVLQGVQGITGCWAKITRMGKQGTFGVWSLPVITAR